MGTMACSARRTIAPDSAAKKYYPAEVSDGSASEISAYESAYKCVAACPGADISSWDQVTSSATGDAITDAIVSATRIALPTAVAKSNTTTGSAKSASNILPSTTGSTVSQHTGSSATVRPSTSSGSSSGTVASVTRSGSQSTHATRGSVQSTAVSWS